MGIEVVADESGHYVREAVTLERLEYCILLDEEGNKRFIQGPAVVLPRPTETFVERSGSRKFRAIELNENSGIYVKVIAPYEDASGAYKVGDELFITGRQQMIYFPRPEHAVIKYNDQEIHYAVAIPAGEGRYVLDRTTGAISLRRGPTMLLPDPRREVVVRRVLDERTVTLWFPGNHEAMAVNQRLMALKQSAAAANEPLTEKAVRAEAAAAPARSAVQVPGGFAGDDFQRRNQFTPPRTLVLDTRYDGAVAIAVWTGYAVMVVNRLGDRRVIVGPATHLLEYDETMQSMELSTGTPKSDERLARTVYLRVLHNKVSDAVEAETKDLCRVHLKLSYRVNFEGDPNGWFNAENYVKFLTDHLRSLIRHAVKGYGVEEFYARSVSILRDVILGSTADGAKRTGRLFEENGMRVYDVEVLDVSLGDEEIAAMLVGAQHAAVRQALAVADQRRKLELTRETETVKREVGELQSGTRVAEFAQKLSELEHAVKVQSAEVGGQTTLRGLQQGLQAVELASAKAAHAADIARREETSRFETEHAKAMLEQRLRLLDAEVKALVEKAGAVSPDLVAALQGFSDRALTERVAESMAPLAILGGESVAEVLGRLLAGTPLAKALPKG